MFYNPCLDQLPSVLLSMLLTMKAANDLLKNKIMAFVKTHKTAHHKQR